MSTATAKSIMQANANYSSYVNKFGSVPREADELRMVYIEADPGPGANIGPQFIDKRRATKKAKGYYEYYPLNKTAAFILKFTLQGMPAELLAEFYALEFGLTVQQAVPVVTGFIGELMERNWIDLTPKEASSHEAPTITLPPRPFNNPLHVNLDVGTNQIGGGGIKIPPR